MKYITILLIAFSLFVTACNSGGSSTQTSSKVIKSGQAGNLNVSLSSASGELKNGANELTLTFTDAAGKTVDVGSASLNFHMPAMGSMAAMNEAATLKTTATPGVYAATVKITMAGDWQAQIAFETRENSGKTSLPVVAK